MFFRFLVVKYSHCLVVLVVVVVVVVVVLVVVVGRGGVYRQLFDCLVTGDIVSQGLILIGILASAADASETEIHSA